MAKKSKYRIKQYKDRSAQQPVYKINNNGIRVEEGSNENQSINSVNKKLWSDSREKNKSKEYVNSENRCLRNYFKEITKYALLSPDEEIVLADKIKNGDQHALEKLINANLRFVVSIAKQYRNQGVHLNDLINEGNIGLIEAAKRFDGTRGVRFISYAVWRIWRSIKLALSKQSNIMRLPEKIFDRSNRVRKIYSVLQQIYGREPNIYELSNKLDISHDDVSHMLEYSRSHISLDAQISQDRDYTILDVTPDHNRRSIENSIDEEIVNAEVRKALSVLPERERKIIEMYYGFDGDHNISLREIGRRFSLSQEMTRSIINKAINKLGSMPGIKALGR